MAALSSHLSCTTHDARSRVTKSTWADGCVIVLIQIHALLVKPWPNFRKRYEFVRATTHGQQLGFSATARYGCSGHEYLAISKSLTPMVFIIYSVYSRDRSVSASSLPSLQVRETSN